MSWYSLKQFVNHWVWPAYYLRNLIFHRYDLVRLPGIRPYEYSDVTERLFLANMQLVVEFIEREQPEKFVVWYGDDAISGPRWNSQEHPLFPMPDYDDKFILDIVKEVYHWYKVTLPMKTNELTCWTNEWFYSRDGFPNYAEEVKQKAEKLEDSIEDEKRKYLHFCVELRDYLWT